jgi:glutamate-1-semialdehyde aminotransferase
MRERVASLESRLQRVRRLSDELRAADSRPWASQIRDTMQLILDSVGTTVTGTPIELELEYEGELRDLFHRDELLRFTNSGLEATLLAVRLARASTRKRKVTKFVGHYHGAVRP